MWEGALLGESTLVDLVFSDLNLYEHIRLLTYLLTSYLLTYLLTAIEFSPAGSSPYTSTDKTNNIHKWNNIKTEYK